MLGAGPVKRFEFFVGEKAHQRQCAVHGGAGVSLGADELVTLRPCGVLRVKAHFAAVKHGQHIRDAQCAADMPLADGVDGLNGRGADLAGQSLVFSGAFQCYSPFSGMVAP